MELTVDNKAFCYRFLLKLMLNFKLSYSIQHSIPRVLSIGSESLVRFNVLILLAISFGMTDVRTSFLSDKNLCTLNQPFMHTSLLLPISWMASITVGTDFNSSSTKKNLV